MLNKPTFSVAIPSDVRTLDPSQVEDTFSFLVTNQVFEGLTHFADGSMDVEPCLADSWSNTADFRTWTLRLRSGIRFSDGSPLSAADVVASFARSKDYGGKCAARDDATIEFRLDQPNSRFIEVLAQMPFAVSKPAGDGSFLGTGAYKIVSRRIGREVVLARSETSRHRATIENVTVRVIQFTTLLGKGLVEGEIDLSDSVTPAMLPVLRKAENVKIHYQMGLNTGFLAINTQKPHLSDHRIRTAIACAIDRTPMLQRFFPSGYGEPAKTLLPPHIFRGKATEFHPFDPAKAKQLLAAAGYTGTLVRIRPTWAPRPYLPDPPAIASEIARMLKAVGFQVQEEGSPSTSEYQALKASGNFDLLVAGWIADDTLPFTFLSDNLLSSKVGATNIPRYSSASMDALLARMRQSAGSALDAAVEEAEAMVARDVPLVPLFHGPQIAAAASTVSGRILQPASAPRFWNLSVSRLSGRFAPPLVPARPAGR